MAYNHLLHVGTSAIRLRRHRLALDALSAGVGTAGVLADIGRAGVRSYGSLAWNVALGVTGGIVGTKALLLGLLLLELLAGTGAAAGYSVSGNVVVDNCWGFGCVRSLGEGRHRLCGGWVFGSLLVCVVCVCL
jgi:hypothetical protein